MEKPVTLQQAIQHFSDEQVCIDTVAALRWADGKPSCPACQKQEHYYLSTQKRWKCKGCGRQFSVKLGTIFEDSPLGLDKWLTALWMLVNCRNGVSSWEIHRSLGITQKSAWFLLHRLRLALRDGSIIKMGGPDREIESDETFIGGKAKNMSANRRAQFKIARETSMGDAALVIRPPYGACLTAGSARSALPWFPRSIAHPCKLPCWIKSHRDQKSKPTRRKSIAHCRRNTPMNS
jgi:transposase-like protein